MEIKVNNLLKLAFGSLLLLSFTANADLTVPQQVIEDTSNEIKLVLHRDRDLLVSDPSYVYKMVDEILVPRFDLNRISGLVLGRFWKRTTAEQKVDFQNEFKKMLVRTYATAFNELDDWQTQYLQSRPGKNENFVTVRTQITRNGAPPLAVDYRMNYKDDVWKVYDVKIEGMSLVTNYRSSFSRLMRTSGMNGLISYLSKNNNQKAEAKNENEDLQTVAHSSQ